MASIGGMVGLPLGIADYSAAKGGVIALTRTAAIEYVRQGIRVNAVCPGVVRTALLDQAINAGMFTELEAAALHPTGVHRGLAVRPGPLPSRSTPLPAPPVRASKQPRPSPPATTSHPRPRPTQPSASPPTPPTPRPSTQAVGRHSRPAEAGPGPRSPSGPTPP
nr:SDR family oxidoreductase [Streptomyces sp. SID4985]